MKDVCILLAAWNAERTLSATLRSALAQVGVDFEVVAVDDASTDSTLDLLREAAAGDPRLTVLQSERNIGPAAARNMALAASDARYVTVLDADDVMERDRLSRLVSLAEAGGWDIVADDLYKVDDIAPGSARSRVFSQVPIGRIEIGFEDFVRGNLSRLHGGRGELGFLKPLMRRDFLVRNDLSYNESLRLGEDYVFYARALAAGARFLLTDPMGYCALVRPESLSGSHRAADLAALVSADRELRGLTGLSGAERRILREHEIETQKRWRWLWLIEAVKARDVAEIARCFAAPPAVVATLVSNLWEQAVVRSRLALSGPVQKGPGQ